MMTKDIDYLAPSLTFTHNPLPTHRLETEHLEFPDLKFIDTNNSDHHMNIPL